MSKERPKRNIIQKKYVSIDRLHAVDRKFVRWSCAYADVKSVNFDGLVISCCVWSGFENEAQMFT